MLIRYTQLRHHFFQTDPQLSKSYKNTLHDPLTKHHEAKCVIKKKGGGIVGLLLIDVFARQSGFLFSPKYRFTEP